MVSLTFGEQVKIILSRKGMTIKELAEEIEQKTGKKMSRQNLTQRLGRDNFQEQDMRMIAEILGCSFQLSILATAEAAEKASVVEEDLPTEQELRKLEAKKEQKKAREEAKKESEERDLTMGEFVEMMEAPVVLEQPEEAAEDVKEAETEEPADQEEIMTAAEESISEEAEVPQEEVPAEETPAPAAVEPEPEVKVQEKTEVPKKSVMEAIKKKFEPIKKRLDEDEDLEKGDVNPYTGHEYQTNSVRMHPKRIGYVQVYDRKEHKWTDMTEWAFLGVEERKKATLGKAYEPPIYLD